MRGFRSSAARHTGAIPESVSVAHTPLDTLKPSAPVVQQRGVQRRAPLGRQSRLRLRRGRRSAVGYRHRRLSGGAWDGGGRRKRGGQQQGCCQPPAAAATCTPASSPACGCCCGGHGKSGALLRRSAACAGHGKAAAVLVAAGSCCWRRGAQGQRPSTLAGRKGVEGIAAEVARRGPAPAVTVARLGRWSSCFGGSRRARSANSELGGCGVPRPAFALFAQPETALGRWETAARYQQASRIERLARARVPRPMCAAGRPLASALASPCPARGPVLCTEPSTPCPHSDRRFSLFQAREFSRAVENSARRATNPASAAAAAAELPPVDLICCRLPAGAPQSCR